MELLELDPPSYGVSTHGIYIIDDDGEQVCHSTPKSQPSPGSTSVNGPSPSIGSWKIRQCTDRLSVLTNRH
jgi:hypothetical protein